MIDEVRSKCLYFNDSVAATDFCQSSFSKTTKHIAIKTATQSATPQSVEDYYLLLPPDYRSSIKDRSARRAAIKIHDKKNGYIRAAGDDWEGYIEVALFRKPDGGALIGLSEVSFGPRVSQNSIFWNTRRNDGTTAQGKCSVKCLMPLSGLPIARRKAQRMMITKIKFLNMFI